MRRRGRRGSSNTPLAVAAGAILFGSIAMAAILRPSVNAIVEPGTCDARFPGPTVATAVDASNALAPRNAASVRAAILAAIPRRRGTRVIIARISGEAAYKPEILFDRCDPGGASETVRGEGKASRDQQRQEGFLDPLDLALAKLAKPTNDSKKSYLTDTVMRLASDPAMHLDAPGSTLVFASDFIESTEISKPYETGIIILPPVHEPFLASIAVRMVELPAMPGATMLQGYDARNKWRGWLKTAGSPSVDLAFPGMRR